MFLLRLDNFDLGKSFPVHIKDQQNNPKFTNPLHHPNGGNTHALRLCLDQGFGEEKGKEMGKGRESNGPEQLDPLTFPFPFPVSSSNP